MVVGWRIESVCGWLLGDWVAITTMEESISKYLGPCVL